MRNMRSLLPNRRGAGKQSLRPLPFEGLRFGQKRRLRFSFTPGFSRVIGNQANRKPFETVSRLSLAQFTWLKPGVNKIRLPRTLEQLDRTQTAARRIAGDQQRGPSERYCDNRARRQRSCMIRHQTCAFAVLPDDRAIATRYHQSEDLTGPNNDVHHAIAIDVGERHTVHFPTRVSIPKYLTVSSVNRDVSSVLGYHQHFSGAITIKVFSGKSATGHIILDCDSPQRAQVVGIQCCQSILRAYHDERSMRPLYK